MEIFVSAGEASSDIHCAHLIRELKKLGDVTAFGLGGDRMQAEGVKLLMHSREFSTMGGPLEVIGKIPRRRKLERLLERRLFSQDPKDRVDGAILVDNGEINLRLASMLNFFGVPVVYFVPPKVWVWRSWRIEDLAQHVKLVLSILPFEEKLYRDWEIPFEYVGNPLADEIPKDLTAEEARRRLGIDAKTPVLTVLPGSRGVELRYHVPLFSEAIRAFAASLPKEEPRPLVLVPAAQAVDAQALEADFRARLDGAGVEVKIVRGQSHECLKAARAAIVKSGTSTLEAAVLGTPMVLSYRSSRSAEWIYRHVVRYRGYVGLVNLFFGDEVVEELVLDRCTPAAIAEALGRVYRDGPAREKMLATLARTRGLLAPRDGGSPLKAAARASWEAIGKRDAAH